MNVKKNSLAALGFCLVVGFSAPCTSGEWEWKMEQMRQQQRMEYRQEEQRQRHNWEKFQLEERNRSLQRDIDFDRSNRRDIPFGTGKKKRYDPLDD